MHITLLYCRHTKTIEFWYKSYRTCDNITTNVHLASHNISFPHDDMVNVKTNFQAKITSVEPNISYFLTPKNNNRTIQYISSHRYFEAKEISIEPKNLYSFDIHWARFSTQTIELMLHQRKNDNSGFKHVFFPLTRK